MERWGGPNPGGGAQRGFPGGCLNEAAKRQSQFRERKQCRWVQRPGVSVSQGRESGTMPLKASAHLSRSCHFILRTTGSWSSVCRYGGTRSELFVLGGDWAGKGQQTSGRPLDAVTGFLIPRSFCQPGCFLSASQTLVFLF